MQTMSIKEARVNFCRLLDLAEKGETVVITRYGRASARLCPVPAPRKALPALGAFRASVVRPATGLARTVILARREERF